MPESISLAQARRIAVAAQLRPRAARYKTVLERLGCIQLDTISAVRRAHELTLLARGLDLDEVTGSLDERRTAVAFEGWGHAMSLLPVSAWPYHSLRRSRWRDHWREHPVPASAIADVRSLVAEHGSVTVGHFPSGAMHRGEGPSNMGDSWNLRTDHKRAAELLMLTGELACTHRIGFKRVYRSARRAVPARHFWDADEAECRRYLVGTALRNLGVATTKDVADYFRIKVATAEATLRELEIEQVAVEGWRSRAWVDPGVRRLRTPGTDRPVAVSMFDQLVWLRERMARLWGHDWKIEIYVPRAKRTFGYYCLPIVVGDDIPGRVALRRNNGELVVEAAQWDESRADPEHLKAAVDRVADWVDAKARWEAPRA
ncbi:DNA glycosylase AlkZ-like family protein [Glycomyces xiaoerkulensis]|uniref:DNA glycosylase AlkZ-like family protein n=1 Tax=Glycomyces xiaoerkulensis TaxID=2038139 RepID=UPI0013000613|nr:crosslink repair DNA glycosylase YcaQ family protein [Glycomyces xiaoerkulensis]